jgi:hypothetical protein
MMRPQFFALTVFAAIAVFSESADAAAFTSNPYTPGGDIISLSHSHPAFGSEPPADSLSLLVSGNETRADSESREATSSTDIERLETFFGAKMVVNYAELAKYPKGSGASAPWPSSYWPTYEDGINYVWNAADRMPPSEKYARAYGLDPAEFTKKVSQTSGIMSQSMRTKCTQTSDCAPLKDSSACAKRTGETSGFCIPTWFGVCHAWAPAAIEEREPRCAVTKNGVTFQPFDIKALITQMYDGANLDTIFTGTRFNGPDQPVRLDNFDRYIDPTRRDMGPGFFHIALVNILGIRKASVVVDVDQDSQVWNQPVRGYEVMSATTLTPSQASQTFFNTPNYQFNAAAASIVFIQLKFQYVVEAGENGPLVSTNKVDQYTTTVYYEYILELDTAGNVIGGEWVRASKKTHPDFLWFPAKPPAMNAVSDIGIKYSEVRELLDASADCKLDAPDSVTPKPAGQAPAAPAPAPMPGSLPPTPVVPALTPATPGAPLPTSVVPVVLTPVAGDADIGTVSSPDDAYSAIAEWLKKWLAGRSSN